MIYLKKKRKIIQICSSSSRSPVTQDSEDTLCPWVMHARASCMLYKTLVTLCLGVMHAPASWMLYKIPLAHG